MAPLPVSLHRKQDAGTGEGSATLLSQTAYGAGATRQALWPSLAHTDHPQGPGRTMVSPSDLGVATGAGNEDFLSRPCPRGGFPSNNPQHGEHHDRAQVGDVIDIETEENSKWKADERPYFFVL